MLPGGGRASLRWRSSDTALARPVAVGTPSWYSVTLIESTASRGSPRVRAPDDKNQGALLGEERAEMGPEPIDDHAVARRRRMNAVALVETGFAADALEEERHQRGAA